MRIFPKILSMPSFLSMVILLAIAVTACESEAKCEQPKEDEILGEWSGSLDLTITIDGESTSRMIPSKFIFKSDYTGFLEELTAIRSFEYTYLPSTGIVNIVYTLSNGVSPDDEYDYTEVYEVVELEENVLTLAHEYRAVQADGSIEHILRLWSLNKN